MISLVAYHYHVGVRAGGPVVRWQRIRIHGHPRKRTIVVDCATVMHLPGCFQAR